MSIFFAFFLLPAINATKHLLQNDLVVGFPEDLDFESMYSNQDHPGKFNASINYDLSFTGPTMHSVYLVIGKRYELNDGLSCDESELVTVFEPSSKSPFLEKVTIGPEGTASLKGSYSVNESELYSGFIISCEMETLIFKESEFILVSGSLSFLNPFGYLPAHRYPLYDLYFVFASIYFLLLIGWYLSCHKYKKNLMPYHISISLVLIFAVFEMILHGIDTVEFNTLGQRSHVIYLFAKIFLISRRLLSRIMLVLVCSGIGISHNRTPTALKNALSVISTAYFGANILLEFQRDFKVKDGITFVALTMSVLISLIDVIFFVWLIMALYDSISRLNEDEKYKQLLYRQFFVMMIVGLVMAMAFSLLEINYVRESKWLLPSSWNIYWVYEVGLPEIHFLYYLVAVAYIMFPSKNVAAYQQLAEGDDIENNLKKEVKKEVVKDSSESEQLSSLSSEDDLSGDEKISTQSLSLSSEDSDAAGGKAEVKAEEQKQTTEKEDIAETKDEGEIVEKGENGDLAVKGLGEEKSEKNEKNGILEGEEKVSGDSLSSLSEKDSEQED